MKWLETDFVKVQSIEDFSKNLVNVKFVSKNFGIETKEIPKKDYELFKVGKKYISVYGVSGMPDFLGDKYIPENIVTISYFIERIFDGDKCIYEFKE